MLCETQTEAVMTLLDNEELLSKNSIYLAMLFCIIMLMLIALLSIDSKKLGKAIVDKTNVILLYHWQRKIHLEHDFRKIKLKCRIKTTKFPVVINEKEYEAGLLTHPLHNASVISSEAVFALGLEKELKPIPRMMLTRDPNFRAVLENVEITVNELVSMTIDFRVLHEQIYPGISIGTDALVKYNVKREFLKDHVSILYFQDKEHTPVMSSHLQTMYFECRAALDNAHLVRVGVSQRPFNEVTSHYTDGEIKDLVLKYCRNERRQNFKLGPTKSPVNTIFHSCTELTIGLEALAECKAVLDYSEMTLFIKTQNLKYEYDPIWLDTRIDRREENTVNLLRRNYGLRWDKHKCPSCGEEHASTKSSSSSSPSHSSSEESESE